MCKINSDGCGKGEQDLNLMCCNIMMESHTLFQYMRIFFQIIYQQEDRHLRLTGRLQKTAEDEQYYCWKHDACPNWRVFFSTLFCFKWAVSLLQLSRLTSSSLDALYIELKCPPSFPWLSEIATAEYQPNRISSLSSSTHLNAIQKEKKEHKRPPVHYHSYEVFIMASICNSSNTFNFIY